MNGCVSSSGIQRDVSSRYLLSGRNEKGARNFRQTSLDGDTPDQVISNGSPYIPIDVSPNSLYGMMKVRPPRLVDGDDMATPVYGSSLLRFGAGRKRAVFRKPMLYRRLIRFGRLQATERLLRYFGSMRPTPGMLAGNPCRHAAPTASAMPRNTAAQIAASRPVRCAICWVNRESGMFMSFLYRALWRSLQNR